MTDAHELCPVCGTTWAEEGPFDGRMVRSCEPQTDHIDDDDEAWAVIDAHTTHFWDELTGELVTGVEW